MTLIRFVLHTELSNFLKLEARSFGGKKSLAPHIKTAHRQIGTLFKASDPKGHPAQDAK